MKMSPRFLVTAGALAIVIVSVSPAFVPVAGQAQTSSAATWTPPKATYSPPRTPWGDPDLQGVWDYQSRIPMQRPAQLKGKATLTDAELAEFAKAGSPNQDPCGIGTRANEECSPDELADVGAYNEFWNNRNILKDNRTSLIEDPPDGRFPPMTPEAQKRQAAIQAARSGGDRARYDSWEDFPTVTRCIAEHTPNGPQGYNSGTLITQSPGWIVMFRERLDTRIIPLDKRPHIGEHIRQWNGDSRGWWEGGTLVVETTNFTDKQIIGGGAGSTIPMGIPLGNMHLVERWVPVSATRMHYYATITDPKTWTRPWTFMLPWEQDDTYTLYEFACHEANISIGNSLRGQRLLDKKATEDAAKGGQPIDRTSAGLVGATEAAVRAKLGEPASVEFNGTRWTYQTVGGTLVLHLFFAENKVKIVTPNDLPLDAVRRR
jgi:hypothetical protein